MSPVSPRSNCQGSSEHSISVAVANTDGKLALQAGTKKDMGKKGWLQLARKDLDTKSWEG